MEARLVCKQLGYFPYCKFELHVHVSNIVIQLHVFITCVAMSSLLMVSVALAWFYLEIFVWGEGASAQQILYT